MILEKISKLSAMFRCVCLGGTFDGIHAGHKLVFKDALKLCNEKLFVGVTNTNMIKKKTLWELIAPVEERIGKVHEYLTSINPNLKYHVVPIQDLYGPTIEEKEIECIVVSKETVRGGHKINEARAKKGWPELKIHVVDLLLDNDSNIENCIKQTQRKKISSSAMRMDKLGTIFRPPIPNESIPISPYIIGLTGGVASGKTAIGKYLESLGFGYINYDLLGHKTYATVGSPIYNEIVSYFGVSILDESSKMIDRRKLGKIVFEDNTKLNKLNSIVWPGIYLLVDQEIERLKDNHDVIVLESALLVESGQNKRVHQVWTSIIPPEEAVRRQVEIRGLDKEEAERRVNAQSDNLTRVNRSNAVFCSLWEPEFTQQQVRRCVQELREKYLKH